MPPAPIPTNGELAKVVAGHEAIIQQQQAMVSKIFDRLDALSESNATIVATLKTLHTPETCPRREQVEQHERDIRQLRSDRDTAQGAGKALLWAAGVVAGLVSVIVGFAEKVIGGR